MALFDKFKSLIDSHAAVKAVGADPFGVKMERVLSPTEAIIEGRKTILVGTNNYLGLTFDDRLGRRRGRCAAPLRHGHHRLAHRQRQLSGP